MHKKMACTTLIMLFISGLALAQMGSEDYSVPTSVISGSAAPMSSEGYQTDSTLGQPSPLMDPANPFFSTNYALYPGFWYTVEIAALDICECDLNHDGRCNMFDWGWTDCP